MELTDTLKAFLCETANSLKGSAKQLFMARTVREFGPGVASRAERELGWNRKTLRKAAPSRGLGLACEEESKSLSQNGVNAILTALTRP